MSMQTDVLASAPLTATGQVTDNATNNLGSVRIKGIYGVCAGAAGSIVLRDGGASGSTKLTFNTVAGVSNTVFLTFPGEGILFRTNVHGTVSNVTSAIFFYG